LDALEREALVEDKQTMDRLWTGQRAIQTITGLTTYELSATDRRPFKQRAEQNLRLLRQFASYELSKGHAFQFLPYTVKLDPRLSTSCEIWLIRVGGRNGKLYNTKIRDIISESVKYLMNRDAIA